MRVLLDVSVLGLGHAAPELRGGSFRVHEHLAEGLARSGECDLLLCANYSSVAFAGCVEYLRTRPELSGLPLLGPPAARGSRVGRLARSAHRTLRRLVPGGVLPAFAREGARWADRRFHPQVHDAKPPVDIFHSLGARLPPRVPGAIAPQRVVNIYDLAPIRLPALYGSRQRHLAEARLAGLRPEDWVITTSQASRTDLAELAGVDPARVFVVPLAADPRLFSPGAGASRAPALRARLGIGDGPYLLAINARDARKNIEGAIDACARAARCRTARGLVLVVVGPPPQGPRFRRVLAEAAHAGVRVIAAGYVDDEEMAALYGSAVALLYPSLYEGFGLPLLEAMQCGTPVIAGRVSSIPEVAGDAALLVQLDDPDALAGAVFQLWSDGAVRDRLSTLSLRRAAQFGWERTVRETLAAYRAMARAAAPAR
jgi:glycosyltransferase involved in cell wall biosynthesis